MSNDEPKPPASDRAKNEPTPGAPPSERSHEGAAAEVPEGTPRPEPTLVSLASAAGTSAGDSDPPPVEVVSVSPVRADTADTASAQEDFRAEDASERDVVVEEPPEPSDWRRFLPLGLAVLTPLAFFFILPPLTKSGMWDPYELNVADLARRVALNLHGATSLALEGADNSLPHLNDLGRPQLPFTSIALGFKLFGLHEWAGRAPLALWGLAGVVATYAFVARLVDKRAGL
jgi:hypothetical protein